VEARPATETERKLLDGLLGHSFEGVEALRRQWKHALVRRSCSCGCGSIGFVFDDRSQLEPSTARNPLPVEAEVLDEQGTAVGGVIVLLRDAYLDDVDVHAYGREPLALPTLRAVRWRT
jgi:hypothetical protein